MVIPAHDENVGPTLESAPRLRGRGKPRPVRRPKVRALDCGSAATAFGWCPDKPQSGTQHNGRQKAAALLAHSKAGCARKCRNSRGRGKLRPYIRGCETILERASVVRNHG
jgi:hypothetical protein